MNFPWPVLGHSILFKKNRFTKKSITFYLWYFYMQTLFDSVSSVEYVQLNGFILTLQREEIIQGFLLSELSQSSMILTLTTV